MAYEIHVLGSAEDAPREERTFRSAQRFIARLNRRTQDTMVDDLVRARQIAGIPLEDVAHALEISLEEAEDVEAGDYELNLTELRHWSLAIQAFVEIKVHSCAFDRAPAIHDALARELQIHWEAHQAEPIPWDMQRSDGWSRIEELLP